MMKKKVFDPLGWSRGGADAGNHNFRPGELHMKRSFRVLCLVGLAVAAVVAAGSFSPACARRGDGTQSERSSDDDGSGRRGDPSNRGDSSNGGYSNRGDSGGGGGYSNRGGSTYRQDYSYRGGSAYRGRDGYRGEYRGGYPGGYSGRGGYVDHGGYSRHHRYQGRYDHCAGRYRVGGHRFQRCMDGYWQ